MPARKNVTQLNVLQKCPCVHISRINQTNKTNPPIMGKCKKSTVKSKYRKISSILKGALCSFGKDILFRERSSFSYFFFLNKLNKQTLFLFSQQNKLNKLADLQGQHNSMLFYFVHMWRTPPPFSLQTVFWGPYFPLRAACLFSYGGNFFFLLLLLSY